MGGVMIHRGQQRQTFSSVTVSKAADSQACNKVLKYRFKLQGPHRGFAFNQSGDVGLTSHKGLKESQEMLKGYSSS